MKRFAMILLVPMAAAVSALAHGKPEPALGTITTITDSSITVQTTVNKTRTNATNAKTMVMRNTDHLTMKDLKACDGVA